MTRSSALRNTPTSSWAFFRVRSWAFQIVASVGARVNTLFVDDAPVALVEFYTDGCGICASMEPVIGNVARGVEADLAVGLVNPRDDPPLVERFDVRSVPLFVLFVDGEPVARRAEGFIPGEDLAAWVDEHAA